MKFSKTIIATTVDSSDELRAAVKFSVACARQVLTRRLRELEIERVFQVKKLTNLETRYGPAIVATLTPISDALDKFWSFLPTRIVSQLQNKTAFQLFSLNVKGLKVIRYASNNSVDLEFLEECASETEGSDFEDDGNLSILSSR